MRPPEAPKSWAAQERQIRPFVIVGTGLIALFELATGSYALAALWAAACALNVLRKP
jgi:hypothetical protein